MTAVGTQIRERTAPANRSNPTNTGTAFVAGTADRGPIDSAVKVTSTSELERSFGARQAYSSLWDVVDNLFREGTGVVYVSRVVGPNPTTGTLDLLDAGGVVSLTVTPKNPGAWSGTLRIAVLTSLDDATIPADQFQIRVTDTVLGVLESSPNLASQADAVSWAAQSEYINIVLGASTEIPDHVAAPGTAFSASTDDRTNATDTEWGKALDLFVKDLGPGQVLFANRTTSTAHGQLLDHAAENNRWAPCDAPDTTSKASLLAAAAALRAHPNRRFGALFGTWVQVAPLVQGGTNRDLQPSAVVAGIIGRNDGAGVSPNQAPGGDLGDSNTAIAVKNSFPNESDRSDLNEGCVNLFILKNGVVRNYGFRSLASKVTDPNWWQAANARLYMAIAARADNILEKYVLKKIDGKGILFSNLKGELDALCQDYHTGTYFGSLYGDAPEDAYYVDVGPTVNTPETIANGEIHAVMELTMSPTGERVILDIVKKRIAG